MFKLIPAIFFTSHRKVYIVQMKELSVFVDESGDFGTYSSHSPYYIVTMVFHNQSRDLEQAIKKLDNELQQIGYDKHVVHTAPLIRREEKYQFMLPNERRTIFSKLFYFVVKSNIQYKSFVFHKKEFSNIHNFEMRMIKDISNYMRANLTYFQSFDKIILYYDNGQHELSQILKKVLRENLAKYEIRKITPNNYKLFQAADLICTLTLLEEKLKTQKLSKSEQLIFHSPKALKKDFLKAIHKKEL